ncbi:tRNA(Met) cytidine acetyltransferase TmcA [Colwellia echini]|uniref:tRNA(Met) cytidine acetyltransferase TmcA n=1 Tax=Colwellia echini TaxID=1982103 RepID=A0ABY3MXZ4_9GAMM|nr:GNAT family N-acetyltransferase [Colwellia echini]TYK65907.1 tRNA(Met) cytidine acetyltransferase [Colwellia echini]
MNEAQTFLLWFNDYAKDARNKCERRLVILSGSELWAFSLLEAIKVVSQTLTKDAQLLVENTLTNGINPLSETVHESCLIYGDSAIFKANVQRQRFRDKLGSESSLIIFADNRFNIDAFAALSGTLKAGGVMFLVTKSLAEDFEQSLFFKRFYSLAQKSTDHIIITETQSTVLPELTCHEITQTKILTEGYPLGCITAEQYSAVSAINKVVSGHRKRPLVLTADRGRGKSSALAIACAQLMKSNKNNDFSLVITAPDIQSLSVFYRQLKQSLLALIADESLERSKTETLNDLGEQSRQLYYGKASLSFIAVDQLIKQPIQCNLLLVDEAAAIPVYLLEQLLSYYHRLVFSSTIHGYEGAGRSFTLKFQKTLDRLCPQWVSLHINQPIRWRENDPLEQLVFETCLLNAELPELNNAYGSTSLSCKVIGATTLVTDEVLLRQVFAILVTAHYQTKPSDLQLMLDNPQVQVVCLFNETDDTSEVVGVALLMTEGAGCGISNTDIMDVKQAKRRLRNHFLPQSLLSHSGFDSAFNYKYLRIMRIAIHPTLQLQGLGSYFIKEIELIAKQQKADFIGSSFGASSELLAFWLKAEFKPVRLGFTKDKASGEHSALMIKGLNSNAFASQQLLGTNFYRSFDYLLLDEYKSLAPELVHQLLSTQTTAELQPLNLQDLANVTAYSTGERLYSSCVYSLYLWFKHQLTISKVNEQYKLELVLITRLLQKHDIDKVCQQFGYTGKKMLNNAIKDYVALRLSSTAVQ